MLDARYHSFYLIAVFLMLGLGIMVGASFYGPAQVRQQQKTLANLRAQVNGAVQEGVDAKRRLAQMNEAVDTLRPALVRGKLTGRHVVLLQTGTEADAAQAAARAVTDAGGSVMATVTFHAKWAFLTDRQRASLLNTAVSSDAPADNGPILAALALALTTGLQDHPVSDELIQNLQTQGLITVTGSLAEPSSLFVIVGGSDDETSPDTAVTLDTPLLSALTARPVTIVGCESLAAAPSSVPVYQKAGIATIDCITLPLGQLALPFALRGERDDYGLKPAARRLLPESLEGTPAR